MNYFASRKSTVASGLAQRLGLEFVEGDDAHSEENIRKMSSGVSLSDEVWASGLFHRT